MTAQITAQLPDLSTWVFYAASVSLVVMYLTVVALLLRPRGFSGRGQLPPTTTTMCVLFLLACSVLHLELAVNAFRRASVVDGGTGVDVHLTLVTVVKLAVVVVGLVLARRHTAAGSAVVEAPPARALEISEAHICRARIDDAHVEVQEIGESHLAGERRNGADAEVVPIPGGRAP